MKTLDEAIHEYIDELSFLYLLQTTTGNHPRHIRNQQKTVDTLASGLNASIHNIMPDHSIGFMDTLHHFAQQISFNDDNRDSVHFRVKEFLLYMFSYLHNPENRVN